MKHPLCRTHYKEAIHNEPEETRAGFYLSAFPLRCIFCQHDAAMHERRSLLESADRAWAKGTE